MNACDMIYESPRADVKATTEYLEKSPSWSRAHDWKSCNRQKRFESSNLSFSASGKGYLWVSFFAAGTGEPEYSRERIRLCRLLLPSRIARGRSSNLVCRKSPVWGFSCKSVNRIPWKNSATLNSFCARACARAEFESLC